MNGIINRVVSIIFFYLKLPTKKRHKYNGCDNDRRRNYKRVFFFWQSRVFVHFQVNIELRIIAGLNYVMRKMLECITENGK